jgi:hypothetical protein
MTPPGGYNGGNVYVSIPKPEAGINLQLALNGIPLAVDDIVHDKEYEVKSTDYMTITAVPLADSYET